MSKRKQTENLHLYAYELTTGLPTFLKDWSDNMAILDGAHSSVLSLINALDVRLTTAEGTLEDLSPESIQDYKIRLDALEKKVVINTNGIKDVNTKIATVNAQINTINAEQIVQDNRLTALETLGASHTELINALRTDLTGVDGRVTTLEQCCENVQHEITDMQHDIDGFNDDVTALATQVSTLSDAVTELTELVNSLQLDVVSQRLDSFEASLTALTDRVTSAENNIVAQGSTLEDHNTRITANENNIENIDTEIGNTDYSEIGDSVSASLVELANRIRALTPQEYDVLVSRLNTVETEVGDIEGAVDNLDSSVSALQTSVASKASASDVSLLQGDVSTLQDNVSGLQTNVGTVQNDIATLNNDVGDIQAVIPSDVSASNMLATNSQLIKLEPILTVDNSQSSNGIIHYTNLNDAFDIAVRALTESDIVLIDFYYQVNNSSCMSYSTILNGAHLKAGIYNIRGTTSSSTRTYKIEVGAHTLIISSSTTINYQVYFNVPGYTKLVIYHIKNAQLNSN